MTRTIKKSISEGLNEPKVMFLAALAAEAPDVSEILVAAEPAVAVHLRQVVTQASVKKEAHLDARVLPWWGPCSSKEIILLMLDLVKMDC